MCRLLWSTIQGSIKICAKTPKRMNSARKEIDRGNLCGRECTRKTKHALRAWRSHMGNMEKERKGPKTIQRPLMGRPCGKARERTIITRCRKTGGPRGHGSETEKCRPLVGRPLHCLKRIQRTLVVCPCSRGSPTLLTQRANAMLETCRSARRSMSTTITTNAGGLSKNQCSETEKCRPLVGRPLHCLKQVQRTPGVCPYSRDSQTRVTQRG